MELSTKDSDHREAISSLQAKHSTEIQTLKNLLASSEANNTDLQKENNEIQLKLTRSRNRSVLELDQGLREKSEKFGKEKLSLMEQNKQLRQELDKVISGLLSLSLSLFLSPLLSPLYQCSLFS